MAALQMFLQKGYGSTSLSDLEAATGLGRRSLYNSFGDKRTVFLTALADFRAMAAENNLAPLAEPGAGVDAIATDSGQRRFSVTNGAGVYYLERLQQGTFSLNINGEAATPAQIVLDLDAEPFQELNLRLESIAEE